MSKQIFKGFRQVTATQFANATEKAGYLWFVRTPMETDADPENEGVQDANVLTDDMYDIYFGSRQYGHFRAGELDAIRSSIEALAAKGESDVNDILGLLQGYTDDEGYSHDGLFDVVEKNTEDIKTNANAIQAVSEDLAKRLFNISGDTDNFLFLDEKGGISANFSIGYDEADHVIYLKDKKGNPIEGSGFDADVFVKDSFLEDVTFEADYKGDGPHLVFTWQMATEEGYSEGKVTTVPISSFFVPYSGGTAVSLEDTIINVNVAKEENFLEVTEGNELLVSGVTVDKALTKQDITINGGPLAADALKVFTDGKIPANMSVQEILETLFCQDNYATTSANVPSYSLTAATPMITADPTSTLVEVGQPINFSAVTATEVTTSVVNPKVSGFENKYGFSDTIDGDVVTGKTSISGSWDIQQKEGEVYKLTVSTTNFSGQTTTEVTKK